MKLFLHKIILFLLPMILSAYPLDIVLSRFLATCARGETSVWSDIYSGRTDAGVAVYGSSRASQHIDPDLLSAGLDQSVWNFGVYSHNFRIQYLRHLELQKSNPAPEIIVHSLDIFTLQRRPDLIGYAQFLPFLLWNRDMYRYTRDYEGFTSADYAIPLLRYAKRGNAVIKTLLFAEKRRKGYCALTGTWNGDFDAAVLESDIYRAVFDQETLELYDQFLTDCHRRNIRVILVYSPEYIDGQNYVVNRDEVISTFRAFARKHSLPFLDYSADPLSFDRSVFYNALHLNREGAEIFTKKLAKDIRTIISEPAGATLPASGPEEDRPRHDIP